MKDVKYLYIAVWGGIDEIYDMYLIDDYENPLYQTGYYEEREEELRGIDASDIVEPTISHGDWGWLCSSFVPVFDSNGELVCQVGCDVGMEDIMRERRMTFLYIVLAAVGITAVVIVYMNILFRRSVIRPLSEVTKEMKKFFPSEDLDYRQSGVIDLDIKSHDEIEDIYNEIRSMQVRIIDYLGDITTIREEKEKAETEAKNKEKEIGQISREAYRYPLTSVGSKMAYMKKTEEINTSIGTGRSAFAIVMVDVNFLKVINDEHGHDAGDKYIKGCCKTVCQIYKHSPVFRIGGDEFVVILTGEDYRHRDERLEDLRRSFEGSFADTNAKPWERYSAAYGMAAYEDSDKDVEDVFKRADKAMYDNKAAFKAANGGNPVR